MGAVDDGLINDSGFLNLPVLAVWVVVIKKSYAIRWNEHPHPTNPLSTLRAAESFIYKTECGVTITGVVIYFRDCRNPGNFRNETGGWEEKKIGCVLGSLLTGLTLSSSARVEQSPPPIQPQWNKAHPDWALVQKKTFDRKSRLSPFYSFLTRVIAAALTEPGKVAGSQAQFQSQINLITVDVT